VVALAPEPSFPHRGRESYERARGEGPRASPLAAP